MSRNAKLEYIEPPKAGKPPRMFRDSKDVDGVLHLRCRRCREWKTVEAFRPLRNPQSSCGRNSWCKKCEQARRQELKIIERARKNANKPPNLASLKNVGGRRAVEFLDSLKGNSDE